MRNLIMYTPAHQVRAFLVLLTLVLAVGISWGQNLHVNVTYDSASSTLTHPVTSSKTAGGFTTLRSAIQFANFNLVDTIFVPAGTYKLTLVGVKEDSALRGDLDINSSMTIKGAGITSTFVDGNAADRVFSINPKLGTAPTVKIIQLTVMNGETSLEPFQDGGGILIQKANVALDTVAVDSNTVATNGGGIDITTDGGTLVMNGGRLNVNQANNSASDGGGGAYFNAGTVTLNNVQINQNTSGFDGGGLINHGARVAISGGVISNNVSTNINGIGGGFNNYQGVATISNALFMSNSCPSGGGLGVFDSVTITGTTFKWNHAVLGGGGLGGAISQFSGALTIQNSSIDSNSTDQFGGGIFIGGSTGDSWKNVSIGYDTASIEGGGVYDAAGLVRWHGDSLKYNVVLAGGTTYAFANVSGPTTPDSVVNVGFKGNFPLDYSADVVLPVELVSLVASNNAGVVTLTWQTITEVDNAGFNVLRKIQGTASFSEIASFTTNNSLRGAGTSNAPKKYSFTDNAVSPGITYTYKIQSVSTTGAVKDGNTVSATVGIPKAYALYQNFPNPFNPSTTIRFDLKQPSTVTLEVYNILGQRVLAENRGMMNAGSYDQNVDMTRFASGVYIYRIAAVGTNGEKFVALKRMMLVK